MAIIHTDARNTATANAAATILANDPAIEGAEGIIAAVTSALADFGVTADNGDVPNTDTLDDTDNDSDTDVSTWAGIGAGNGTGVMPAGI